MVKKAIPFEFVIEELNSIDPIVKPFFGAHGVYKNEIILFILFKKEEHADDSGIWIATYKEHHESLKKDIPNLRGINVLGSDTHYLNLPEESENFESDTMKLIQMILLNDTRIGRLPIKKKKKKKK